MSDQGGMTLIVKNVTRIVTGFIAVFGVYIALTGHISPGGGFAGGVILASAGVLVVLAFGKQFASHLVNETGIHIVDSAGALGFLAVALCGYFIGVFFKNFIGLGQVGNFWSGGVILLSNFAILIKVGAGLAGVFLALAAFRQTTPVREI